MARGGKREGAGRKINYDSYVAKYKKREKYVEKHGGEMITAKMSEKELKLQYKRMQDELIAKGEKPEHIIDKIINKQSYKYSEETARIFYESQDAKNKIALVKIRMGQRPESADEMISNRYTEVKAVKKDELIQQGKSEKDAEEGAWRYAQEIIGTEFFGS